MRNIRSEVGFFWKNFRVCICRAFCVKVGVVLLFLGSYTNPFGFFFLLKAF